MTRGEARCAASSARELTPSLRNADASWFATVRTETHRARAIASLHRPAAAATVTARSASLSAASSAGAGTTTSSSSRPSMTMGNDSAPDRDEPPLPICPC